MKMLFQFRQPGPKPTLEWVQKKFGFRTEEVDQAYGVTLIDPKDATYVIRVEDTAQDRLAVENRDRSGTRFYADGRIGPMSPGHDS